MKKAELKLKQIVDAHSRSQTTTIITNPYKQGEIITIGYDSFIRVWHSSDLTINPYLTEIVAYNDKFLLGIGNGNIVQLSSEFEIEKQYKDHTDCVTSIVVLPDRIVTASYDGTVHFLNKTSFQVEKVFDFHLPISQCLYHDGFLYVASNPSYKINMTTLQTTQLAKYNQFIVHQGQVFASSDDKGIVFLKNLSNVSLSCQYMLSIGEVILVYAHESVGTLYYHPQQEDKWQLRTYQGLTSGCSILSGVLYNNYVFMTGESGNIYKFKVKLPKKDAKTSEAPVLEQITA